MLNKQGPTKIDWTDYTWNPISGCLHGCPYCYMLRMEKRFPGTMEPKFRPHYIGDPGRLERPARIFTGSSGDMWGDWVPGGWIDTVLQVVEKTPRHTFQFLTKNPWRYGDFPLPVKTAWYGTTVDGTERTARNADMLQESVQACNAIRFVSFEPLLAPVDPDLAGIAWVIIGANSNRGAEKPPKEWADRIIDTARKHGAAVWVKDNYGYPERFKEWPEGVKN